MDNTQESSADIVANMYRGPIPQHRHDRALLCHFADQLEAALKREADSIHRAMVLIAGIEMESPEDPPRLWTALEDAYDALSDALGTDGDTTADEEEAKATGRHFVVKPSGNPAAMREAICTLRTALKEIRNDVLDMVMNHKSEDPDSYAHGLCLSIGGACDMALNSTKEFEKGGAK